jgi:DNA-binding LacI/PurR family transcriptional regulator
MFLSLEKPALPPMTRTTLRAPLSKHAEIAAQLRLAIVSGKLRASDPLASENELCRQFKVSRSPVRRALEELEAERLIRRSRTGACVAGPPSAAPDAVKRLAVVFDCSGVFPGDFVVAEMMRALAAEQSAAAEMKFKLQIEFHPFSGADDAHAKDLLNGGSQDGVLIIGFKQPCMEFLNSVRASSTPLVSFFPQPDNPALNAFWIDQEAGAHQATEFLLRYGHRRIALVLPAPLHSRHEEQRENGYRRAMTEAGGSEFQVVRAEWDVAPPHGPLADLLGSEKRPTALIVAGGMMHGVVAETIAARGLRVPEDVSVIAIDDTEAARLMRPPWSAVRQPIPEGLQQALHRLLALTRNPRDRARQTAIRPELILRESTRAI